MFSDEDIFEGYLEELEYSKKLIRKLPFDDYPHTDYDYSTDDFNDFEYLQDLYL